MYIHIYTIATIQTLHLLPESDHGCVEKVFADKVMEVDASLELYVVDLTGSTGGVEGVVLTRPHLRLLLEGVKEEAHLKGRRETEKI